MKKIIVSLLTIIAVIATGVGSSYFLSKDRAYEIAEKSNIPLTQLENTLILFQNDKFAPCWIFRWEYSNHMTGATFDVYMSLMGKVLKSPPKIPAFNPINIPD